MFVRKITSQIFIQEIITTKTKIIKAKYLFRNVPRNKVLKNYEKTLLFKLINIRFIDIGKQDIISLYFIREIKKILRKKVNNFFFKFLLRLCSVPTVRILFLHFKFKWIFKELEQLFLLYSDKKNSYLRLKLIFKLNF